MPEDGIFDGAYLWLGAWGARPAGASGAAAPLQRGSVAATAGRARHRASSLLLARLAGLHPRLRQAERLGAAARD